MYVLLLSLLLSRLSILLVIIFSICTDNKMSQTQSNEIKTFYLLFNLTLCCIETTGCITKCSTNITI